MLEMITLPLAALEQRAGLADAEAEQLLGPVWLSLARWDPAAAGLLDWAAATMRLEHRFPRGYGPGLAAELLRTEREPRDNGLSARSLRCAPERRESQIFGVRREHN